MPSPLSIAIREHLARYLAGEVSLSEFGDWFVAATWNVDQIDDPAAEEVTYDIWLRLAEYSRGDCTEDELHGLLRAIVEASAANVISAPARASS